MVFETLPADAWRFRLWPGRGAVGGLLGGLVIALLGQASAAAGIVITPSGQGVVALSSGTTAAAELSGITFASGTTYYAVGDNGATAIWQLGISIDQDSGRILSAIVSGSVHAPSLGSDSEGIAIAPGGETVWVADEVASSITAFSLASGEVVGSVDVPAIFAPGNVQANRGLESLSFGGGALWTANEEALVPDGSLASPAGGSWVRLQRFAGSSLAAGGQPAGGQWAYLTDPLSGTSQWTSATRNGLVDLVALPDGGLLTLERDFGGAIPRFRARIYAVDFTAASDVTDVPTLTAGGFMPVGKTLLWEDSFLSSNFEGMALGPALRGGGRSLLLISDDGSGAGGQQQHLLGLVVVTVPEPSALLLAAAGLALAGLMLFGLVMRGWLRRESEFSGRQKRRIMPETHGDRVRSRMPHGDR